MLGGAAALSALKHKIPRVFHVSIEMVLKKRVGIDKYRLAFVVPLDFSVVSKLFVFRP